MTFLRDIHESFGASTNSMPKAAQVSASHTAIQPEGEPEVRDLQSWPRLDIDWVPKFSGM